MNGRKIRRESEREAEEKRSKKEPEIVKSADIYTTHEQTAAINTVNIDSLGGKMIIL